MNGVSRGREPRLCAARCSLIGLGQPLEFSTPCLNVHHSAIPPENLEEAFVVILIRMLVTCHSSSSHMHVPVTWGALSPPTVYLCTLCPFSPFFFSLGDLQSLRTLFQSTFETVCVTNDVLEKLSPPCLMGNRAMLRPKLAMLSAKLVLRLMSEP
ncbi:hypothetical protein BO99DRAFT_13972 [Aspergillus violaceofuscus CBS 115571]|uniref:Uncharacterized protein n=1 Tax=Aspergillus violaceofuscus (strain CBS 115571) TaxID=1450538 RepID=A0A2V5GUL8_ASPV1|nr:hypothetical protein BO99DRAFT_13972 [Aspergillus violaceofuscus CBS 115571]